MSALKHRYTDNWGSLSLAKRTQSNWTCERCGKPCRRPGESIIEFAGRLPERWILDLFDPQGKPLQNAAARFVLTVAHLDQNPQNNEDSNLMALCAPCHLGNDRPFVQHNHYRRLETMGQLSLF